MTDNEYKQLKSDFVDAMQHPSVRRIVQRFVVQSGMYDSAFRPDPHATAFAAGWADAGKWWVANIREFCEHFEPQMRAELTRHFNELKRIEQREKEAKE